MEFSVLGYPGLGPFTKSAPSQNRRLDLKNYDFGNSAEWASIKLGSEERYAIVTINPRPAGGVKGSPCGFSQIAPEVLGISL